MCYKKKNKRGLASVNSEGGINMINSLPFKASPYFRSCISLSPNTSASRNVLGLTSSPAPVIVRGVVAVCCFDDVLRIVGLAIPNGVDVKADTSLLMQTKANISATIHISNDFTRNDSRNTFMLLCAVVKIYGFVRSQFTVN
jgi:hypothetical protein